ncbi:MAG: TolC family protein, partial [Candidatus Marinimicrobia bacterium]|nr:TolC family protein [Candidatus Neomarinimicrobiota bacterium]
DTEVEFLDLPRQDTLKTIAFNNNADYLATQKNLKLARINKDIMQSSYYPSLDISGSYGYSKEQQELGLAMEDPNKSWNVGLSLNFALFNGFRRSIQNQNAKLNIESRQLETRAAKLELQNSLTNALERYQNSKQILTLEKNNLQSAQLNFERTRESYQLGQVTSTRFREAQLNLIQARQGISQAKYDAKVSELQLLKIIGKLLYQTEEQDI